MFHTGARIPGKFPRLEGGGDTSRVMKIGSVAEVNAVRAELEEIVRAWCDWRAKERTPAETEAPAERRRALARKASKAKTTWGHSPRK